MMEVDKTEVYDSVSSAIAQSLNKVLQAAPDINFKKKCLALFRADDYETFEKRTKRKLKKLLKKQHGFGGCSSTASQPQPSSPSTPELPQTTTKGKENEAKKGPDVGGSVVPKQKLSSFSLLMHDCRSPPPKRQKHVEPRSSSPIKGAPSNRLWIRKCESQPPIGSTKKIPSHKSISMERSKSQPLTSSPKKQISASAFNFSFGEGLSSSFVEIGDQRKKSMSTSSLSSVDMSILCDFVNGVDSGCENWFGNSSSSTTNKMSSQNTSISGTSIDSGNCEKYRSGSNLHISMDRSDL